MLTSSADPRRDEQRHYSSSKLAGLNHDSTLKQHRDQSPRPVVQPVVSYGSHGATVTTAGPLATSNMRTTSPSATYAAVAAQRSSPTPAVAADTEVAVNGSLEPDSQSQHDTEHHNVHHRSAAGAGKRDKLDSLPSITGNSLGTKRQVMLDHSSTSADSEDAPEQYNQALLPDQQQQQPAAVAAAELDGTDQLMQDPELIGQQQLLQQQDSVDNVLPSRLSMQSPFGEVVLPTLLGSTDSQDVDLAVQRQQHREGTTTGRPPAASPPAAAGQMLPPSSSGSGRRTSANSPPLSRSDSLSLGAAAAATAGSSGSGRGTTYLAGGRANQPTSSDGGPLDRSEASLSVGNILSCKAAISGAASLEGWLPAGAIAAAVAAAVAESGSPRAAAAATAAAAALMRTSSTASTAGIGRQGSLVFNPLAGQQQQQPSNLGNLAGRSRTATLESQGSFAGWPAAAAAATAAERADTAPAANNAADGGFSWPNMPISRSLSEAQAALSAAQAALRREDSLKLDIQVLAPVLPEDYPEQESEDPDQQQYDPYQQQQHLQQQQQQQHVDKAFFAKVAGWESELVGMLEQQQAPLAIRQIVEVFKDRINSERDKAEFKALCDKWTGVVEYPAGSGIKCLAIKSWMREGAAAAAAAGHDGSRGAREPQGDHQHVNENRY